MKYECGEEYEGLDVRLAPRACECVSVHAQSHWIVYIYVHAEVCVKVCVEPECICVLVWFLARARAEIGLPAKDVCRESELNNNTLVLEGEFNCTELYRTCAQVKKVRLYSLGSVFINLLRVNEYFIQQWGRLG